MHRLGSESHTLPLVGEPPFRVGVGGTEELLAQKDLDARELELAQARLKRALVRSNVAARAQF